MFFHLLYIHLFRPFLKYNPSTSPLPSHISPRKLCSQAAGAVSKLMRLYKRTYGLRQICNIAVYIVHSACTIHLLNLPEKTAKRDIVHGVKHLEEIAEDWLCARRTLSILSVLARKWKIDLPEEALQVFTRTDAKFGFFSTADVPSPKQDLVVQTHPPSTTSPPRVPQQIHQHQSGPRSQNQLQQSLYSYLPDTQPSVSNNTMNVISRPSPNLQNNVNTAQVPSPSPGIGSMNVPNKPLAASIPYPRYPYNSTATSSNDNLRSDSGVASEASGSMTRQVSPNTMFGGVDALVESQDWWLRDQASLVVGFDNWMSAGNGNGTFAGLDPMTGIGTGFYRRPNGNSGGDGFGDDDWNYT
jgi:hypothetical protein